MKKFLVAMVAALVAAVAVFGISASAAEIIAEGECGEELTWALDETGVLTISGKGDMYNYYYNTTSYFTNYYTNNNVFTPWNNLTVNHVVINEGVTSIGHYAFYKTNTETVKFSNSLLSIGNAAFGGCTNLVKVEISPNVTKIGTQAFRFCQNLTSVKIPMGVTVIGNDTFRECKNLLSIDLHQGFTSIGANAFMDCTYLSKIDLPSTLTDIGPAAFKGCDNIKSIKYGGDELMWNDIIIGAENDTLLPKKITYASAKPTTVTLTYNANGGIEPPSPVTVASGSSVAISGEKLSRRNYEFLGWSRSANGGVEFTGGNTITVNADTTLYAVWKSTATFATEIILRIDDKAAQVNGATVQNDVAPIIENSRTMLPARFVAEKLGATVAWDDVARKVIITGSNGTKIEIVVDSTTAYVNGVEHTLDSPAFIRDARTYTPVRFICDNLGANVQWDGVNRIVTITK